MINFSDRVMLFPSLVSGDLSIPMNGINPNIRGTSPGVNYEVYSWVERMDSLQTYTTGNLLFTNPWSRINFYTPVRGLALHSSVFSGDAKILLPEGEEIPSNAAKIVYGELVQYCDQNRRKVFGVGKSDPDRNSRVDQLLHKIETHCFQTIPLHRAYGDFEHDRLIAEIRECQHPELAEQLTEIIQNRKS